MNPHRALAVEIGLNVATILMPIARFWILRKKKRSHQEWISEIFFCMAVTISFTNVWGVCYKLREEIRLRERYSVETVEVMMLAPRFLKMTYIFGMVYIVELWILKGAFIAFYWGLFTGMDSRRKILLPIAAVLVLLSFLSAFLLYVLWARPIELNWSTDTFQVVQHGVFASFWGNTFNSFMNIGSDLIILGLPLLVISTLRLRRPEILALIFVFIMGGMSIAASVTRYCILYHFIRDPPITNETLHILEVMGTVEMTAAVFAYCLPSFRVLYLRVVGLFINHFKDSHSSSLDHSSAYDRHGQNRRKQHTGQTIDTTMCTVDGAEGELVSYGPPSNGAAHVGNAIHDSEIVPPKIYVDKTFDIETETLRSGSPIQLKYPQNSHQWQHWENIHSQVDGADNTMGVGVSGKTMIGPLQNPTSQISPAYHTNASRTVSSQERLKDVYVDSCGSHTNSSNNSSRKTSFEGNLDTRMSQNSGTSKSDYSGMKDGFFD